MMGTMMRQWTSVLKSQHSSPLQKTNHSMMFSADKLRFMVVALSSVASFSTVAANEGVGNQEIVPKQDRMRGAYYGALVADALTLGSHYEYDAPKIKAAYGGSGTIDRYMGPGELMGGETHGIGWGSQNYHPGTVAGDQTDYGEYNVLILEYLATTASNPRPFNVEELIPIWKQRLETNFKQWKCTQTKKAYQQVAQGVPVNKLGGPSNAMSLRFAPVFSYYADEDGVVDAAHKSMFTHKESTAHLGAEFFAKVTFRIIHESLTPRQAIDNVAAESHAWIQQKVQQALTKAEEAMDPEKPLSKEEFVDDLALTSMAKLWDIGKSEPIKVGKASPTEGTLPGAIYFIVKYEDDMIAAFKGNVMVGGDNASRSIAIGMVLGAYHGVEAIPLDLKDGLNHWKHSETLLETFPLLASSKDNEGGQEL
jgi:ADP-ribosylglycohydrolase